MVSKALIAATVVGAATAQIHPLAQLKAQLSASASFSEAPTGPLPTACESALESAVTIFESLPTPAADLALVLEDAITAAVQSDCNAALTGKLASEYTSYTNAASSWADAHSSVIGVINSLCKDTLADITSMTLAGPCETAAATTTASASDKTSSSAEASKTSTPGSSSGSSAPAATTSASASGSATGSQTATSTTSSESNVPTGAAARETGFIPAVMAAFGFVAALL